MDVIREEVGKGGKNGDEELVGDRNWRMKMGFSRWEGFVHWEHLAMGRSMGEFEGEEGRRNKKEREDEREDDDEGNELMKEE